LRPAASTNKASYRLINKILNAMNERKVVEGIFCDLKKVFELLELWCRLDIESHAENISGYSKYCPCSLNIYTYSYHL
jgi:hypothetical protein